MKKNLLVLSALTLSSIATLAGQAQSDSEGPPQIGSPQDGPSQNGPGGDEARRQAHRQKMLQMFDTNHDGTLDDNERAQMRAAMQKRRMEREQGEGSAGGPGASSRGSGFAGRGGAAGLDNPERQEFRQRMLQKFDANHDGKLDDNERAQMHEFMQRRRQEREQQGGGFGGAASGGGPMGRRSNGPSGGDMPYEPPGLGQSGIPMGNTSGGDGSPPVGPPGAQLENEGPPPGSRTGPAGGYDAVPNN